MILTGRKSIAGLLGVHPDRLAQLVRQGAPIRVVGEGQGARYFADDEALRVWATGASPHLA